MKQLIKYPTAELAKEKQFPQNTSYDYYIIGEENLMTDDHYKDFLNDDFKNNLLACPTQSELQRWLRDEHKIDTGLHYWDDGSYSYKIQKIVNGKMKFLTEDIFVGSYEETLEEALLEILKQIK